jgi:hypothetical protein
MAPVVERQRRQAAEYTLRQRGAGAYAIARAAFRQIVFGVNVSPAEQRRIVDLTRHNGLTLRYFQARPNRARFQIDNVEFDPAHGNAT